MSKYTCSSSSASPPKKKVAKQARSLSASEIARNAKHFDTWSTYQACESVAYTDLPPEFAGLVQQIFDTTAQLPRAWVDEHSDSYEKLRGGSSHEFLSFIDSAYESCPDLFSDAVAPTSSLELFHDIQSAFLAWKRLHRIRESQAKVSEATMAANVSKCSVSLPQPHPRHRITSTSLRILNASTVIPDAALFIPPTQLRDLSHAASSPFKKLKRSPLTGSAGRTEAAFASQATPCAQLPALPAFEFAASFWEDKKPVHPAPEDAYRQNRMSIAAAARQLHSLHIHAPLFGLIWADGVVRAHVDWAGGSWEDHPVVYSAPYPGSSSLRRVRSTNLFHEWHIDDPADALKIFLLVRNIDAYTTGEFATRVRAGVRNLELSVASGLRYRPWKRTGTLSVTPLQEKRVNGSNFSVKTDVTSSAEHIPAKRQTRRTRRKVPC